MRKKRKALWAAILSAILLLNIVVGCSSQNNTTSSAVGDVSTEKPITVEYAKDDLDAAWSEAAATTITLSDATATVQGSGAAVKDSTVTINAAGTYLLRGKLTKGQILVNAGKEDLVRLVLDGVSLSSSVSAPIYSMQAGKTVIVLAEGSKNTVTDAANYQFDSADTDEPNAAIFSKGDMTINGTGSLTVIGNFENGIGCKDTLKIVSGSVDVTAANDGIKGRDAVAIKDGTITVVSKGDAIRSNNDEDTAKGWIAIEGGNFTITSEQDAVQAETILQVTGGTFQIVSGGGSANAPIRQDEPGGPWGRMEGAGGFPANGGTDNTSSNIEQKGNGRPQRPDGTPPADNQKESDNKTNSSSSIIQNQADTKSESSSAATEENTETVSTKALKGGSRVFLSGGKFQIDSADDAVHSNGSVIVTGGELNISTGDDGMHADADLVVQDGTITISKSYEGLEGSTVSISGGTIHITSSDDGINAAGGSDDDTASRDMFQANENNEIRFSGGYVVINASGDGIDSNGNVVQAGGAVLVNGPVSSGNGALDFNGSYQISGGILVAAGSSGMAQAPDSDSKQNSLTVLFDDTQEANTPVNVTDSTGKSILTFVPSKKFQSIVVSAPNLKQGSTYTINTGGSSDVNEDGFSSAESYSGGTQLTDVTLSGVQTVISSNGEAATIGGRGGQGGGRPNRNTEKAPDASGNAAGASPPSQGGKSLTENSSVASSK
ncbi:carbohydrate-binding domain-containing protein [Clostridium merdae]|uniref:carbohydrate-binding domain-containing protein n=1 Tax=Clostridium merdae TaxID=1958780 RepID=UPI00117C73F3|nr:carbohydrate-binding domain-containing protein [Clostridium merdae]